MNEKEKARELVKKYYNFVSGWTQTNKPNEYPSAQFEGEFMKIGRAKQCAIIAVDEQLITLEYLLEEVESVQAMKEIRYLIGYWNKVKEEINNVRSDVFDTTTAK